jgi:hypothetical protein
MSSEDTPRHVQGNSPANSESQPSDSDHRNTDIPPNTIPIYNQRAPANNQGNNASGEPNWRRSFRYVRDRFPKADVVLAFFTGVLVIETWMTIAVLTKTDGALHKTADAQEKATEIADRMREITEANERPWLGPSDARVFDNKEKDKPLKVTIMTMNSGRQPALANMHLTLKRYSAEEWQSEAYRPDVYTWQSNCYSTQFSDKVAVRQVFPGLIQGSQTYSLSGSSDNGTPPFFVTDELMRGDDVVVALGCFVYEAFKVTRRTMFCYYYDKSVDIKHLALCPIGQDAN